VCLCFHFFTWSCWRCVCVMCVCMCVLR
jgi:hypothetical protein